MKKKVYNPPISAGRTPESEEMLGYADTIEYGLHMTEPHIPHSFTKAYNPNLLNKIFK